MAMVYIKSCHNDYVYIRLLHLCQIQFLSQLTDGCSQKKDKTYKVQLIETAVNEVEEVDGVFPYKIFDLWRGF